MLSDSKKWFRIALLNLLIVAFIGVLLRYKIAYSLPFIDQKFLLHGHSHFAFAGWVTQALMTLMISYLDLNGVPSAFKKYKVLLILNLVTAYGMVISFPIQGYGFFSILFSTLSIFVSYGFARMFWKDLKAIRSKLESKLWFKASLAFSVLSSVGPFSLSYMMATHNLHEKWYLSSIYFFLHFQYNGWFFFACMGLLMSQLEKFGIQSKSFRTIFDIFFIACFPAYLLSVLWLPISTPVYAIVIVSAVIQLIGWSMFLKTLNREREKLKKEFSLIGGKIMLLSAIAVSIKLLLQLGSTHPQLSQIAFGFRPIVIGYLHLVLLGIITLFILAYGFTSGDISKSKTSFFGLLIFVCAVILNEVALMYQGIEAMEEESITSIHNYLFIIAILLFTGILIVTYSQFRKKKIATF